MVEYQELIKMLKVYYHKVSILHRHLAGNEWFETHELLDNYYNQIAKDIDDVVEMGLSIEIDEPTIQQSLDSYKELEIKNRTAKESMQIVKSYFNDIVAQINRIKELPGDVINRLQEKQLYYRIEADYKLFRATVENIEK